MVLRFSCPCGAPYTLADHLAGRTFTCTACGVVLKIGTPAPASGSPPPARQGSGMNSSDAIVPSMEWSSEQKRPPNLMNSSSGRLMPLDDDSEPLAAPPPSKKPAADAPLALADEEPGEGVWNSLEEDSPAPKRGGKADLRTSGSSRLKTSAAGQPALPGQKTSAKNLRTSGVAKGAGKGTSGRAKARGASSADGPVAAPVSRACPVCEAQIAASAAVCPQCGVRLKEKGKLEGLAWQGPVKALAMLGLAGALGVGIWTFMSAPKKPDRLQPLGKRPPPSTSTEPPTTTATAPTPTTSDAKTPPKPGPKPPRTTTATDADEPDEDPLAPRTTERPPTGKPPRGNDAATSEVALIPEGPLKGDFERLRDAAPGAPLREAIAALAAKPGLDAVMGRALTSLDRTYQLRLHRVRLAAGDDARRRATIESSLSGSGGVTLVFTVAAALDLDPALLASLQKRGYTDGEAAMGRAWADAAQERIAPPRPVVKAFGSAFAAFDEDAQRLVAPALALGGDGRACTRAAEALEHESPTVRALALVGLKALSAGTGPAGEDVAAWKAWALEYAPLRDVLARACVDPSILEPPSRDPLESFSAHLTARREVMSRARELIPILPVFVQDEAARTTFAAGMIGDLLALAGVPGDADGVRRMLAALGSDRGDQGGALIVQGALLACDDAVADEAAAAVTRGVATLDDAVALLPDLQRTSAKAQETLGEWIRSLGPAPADKARLVAGSFRCGWLEAWITDPKTAQHHALRTAVASRLASARLERSLLDALEGEKPGPGAFAQPGDAMAGLHEFGTEGAADRLVKLVIEAQSVDAVRALDRVGDARHGRKLKKVVETTSNSNLAMTLFQTYAHLSGEEAGQALVRRSKPDDPLSAIARPAAMSVVVGREGRDLVLLPFQALTGKTDQRIPTIKEIEALARCGVKADGELLKNLFPTFDKVSADTRVATLVCLARLGYMEGLGFIEGYIYPNHAFRHVGAVCVALLGATQSVDRLETVVMSGTSATNNRIEDAVSVASLAMLSPARGRTIARKYLETAGSLNDPETIAAISMALAYAEDDEGLKLVARQLDPAVRVAVARGISLAVLSRREGILAQPVMDDLRVDPDPAVRAEIAVARGFLGLERASADIVSALSARDEVLDASGRGYGGRSILNVLAQTSDLSNLRSALWAAYDACTPGDGPVLRVELNQARRRELLREARAKR